MSSRPRRRRSSADFAIPPSHPVPGYGRFSATTIEEPEITSVPASAPGTSVARPSRPGCSRLSWRRRSRHPGWPRRAPSTSRSPRLPRWSSPATTSASAGRPPWWAPNPRRRRGGDPDPRHDQNAPPGSGHDGSGAWSRPHPPRARSAGSDDETPGGTPVTRRTGRFRHHGRRMVDLQGKSTRDDIADPLGGSMRDYRVAAETIAGLVGDLIGLAWPDLPGHDGQ